MDLFIYWFMFFFFFPGRTKDCQAAMKMWDRMKLEDIIPSITFKKNFSSLLSAHNIPIPQEYL